MTIDDEIDAVGLLCPLPVLKARKRLKSLETGQVLCVLADDPAAVIDMPHYCNEADHTLVSSEPAAPGALVRRYIIRKG